MNSQIHAAIISSFEDPLNPVAWRDLRDTFKHANYQNVYVRHNKFENNSQIEIRTGLIFDDNEQLELFLNKEQKLAIERQVFEWAALIREKQRSLSSEDVSFDSVYLKYSLQNKSKGACELLFETNVLSFRYRLIEEFTSYSSISKKFDFYEFSESWNDFIKNNDFEKLWNNNKEWTKKVLSTDFRKKLIDEFNLNDQIWPEWKKFDLIIGTDDYFLNIYDYNLQEPYENYALTSKKKGLLENPRHQLLILGHENDFKTALNELVKLTYERAKIKILITYPEKIKHRLALITNTLKILDQSDKCLPEYSTQYFLVLGELIDKTIYWSFYQFGCNGVLLNSHFFTNTGIYKTIEDLTPEDFSNHPIWHDFKTVNVEPSKNSAQFLNKVKPVKDKNDVILHSMDRFSKYDYEENYYVSCNFSHEKYNFMGYVHLSTDYDFREDGEYEISIDPVIFNQEKKQIPLTLAGKKPIFLYDQLKAKPDDLFPLRYKIQAHLEKGIKSEGEIRGFIGKTNSNKLGFIV